MSKKSTTPDTIRVRLGTFESDIMEHPTAHIFVGSKANGDNITVDLPQNGSKQTKQLILKTYYELSTKLP